MKNLTLNNLTILTLKVESIDDFSKARNLLLAQVKTDWVLFLDSDEVLSESLVTEIEKLFSTTPKYQAYQIPRRDIFLGQTLKYGETGRISFVRLAHRAWGKWEGRVHERWIGPDPIGKLHNPILHTPHPTLTSFVDKLDRYSTIAANERYALGIPARIWHIAAYPLAKFVSNYFIKLGLLDGVPGLIHAIMMSWHSYLTHTKLFLLWRKK